MTTDLEALAKNVLKKDNGFTCDGWHQRTLAQAVLDLSAEVTRLKREVNAYAENSPVHDYQLYHPYPEVEEA